MKPEKWLELVRAYPHDDRVLARALFDNLQGWTWRGDAVCKDDTETVLAFMVAIRAKGTLRITTHIDTLLGRVRICESNDGLWNWQMEAIQRRKHAFGAGFRSLDEAVRNALDMCGREEERASDPRSSRGQALRSEGT